jgi:hypothetical protein
MSSRIDDRLVLLVVVLVIVISASGTAWLLFFR